MGFREMRGGDGVSDVEIRRNEIIELLYTYKKYSIDDFAKRFGVSRRTINYDIVYLIQIREKIRSSRYSDNFIRNTLNHVSFPDSPADQFRSVLSVTERC